MEGNTNRTPIKIKSHAITNNNIDVDRNILAFKKGQVLDNAVEQKVYNLYSLI